MSRHPAVFLDRDGTLMVDSGFVDHPDRVELMPGAAEAVRRFHAAGYKVVVATNQSGVARGYFDESRLREIHARLRELLAAGDARLDGIYYCPHLDGARAVVQEYRRDSHLRKPAPGMLRQAAVDMQLDLARSWMIGDSARDIEAGHAAGCRTILLTNGADDHPAGRVQPGHSVSCLLEAAAVVEKHTATHDGRPAPAGSPAPGAAYDDADTHHQDTDANQRRERAAPAGFDNTYGHADEPAGASSSENERDSPSTHRGVPASDTPRATPRRHDALTVLTDIRNLLDRQRRAEMHDDFSLVRLLATLVQMVALVAAGWALWAMFRDDTPAALTRFALAGFLQLVVISMMIADRSR